MNSHFSKQIKLIILIGIIAVLCLAVNSGFSKSRGGGSSETFDGIQLFAEVLAKIEANYVDEVKPKDLIYGAIRGMVGTLDPYSQFMDTDQYNELETDTKGEFGGLGIRIMTEDGWLVVESPMEGTPAFRAGIKAKDRISKIDGEAVVIIQQSFGDSSVGMTVDQAVKKLRGPKGTSVKLEIDRPGVKEPLEFTIVRDIIQVENIRSKMFDNEGMKIGYIRLIEFREKSGEDIGNALAKLKKDGMQGLILDLRYNPGGLLKASIEVADLFLPKDKVVVSTKGRAPGNDQEYKTTDRKDKYTDIPMVCLVNEGSASASEIVGGALQDYKRAVLVGPAGKKTFGKGSVQSVMELRDNTALRLTTAKYYTPSGRSIHKIGLTPDIGVEVPREVEDSILFAGKLGDLEIPKIIKTQETDSTFKYSSSSTEKVVDAQLQEGLNILKLSDYFKNPGIVEIPVSQNTTASAKK